MISSTAREPFYVLHSSHVCRWDPPPPPWAPFSFERISFPDITRHGSRDQNRVASVSRTRGITLTPYMTPPGSVSISASSRLFAVVIRHFFRDRIFAGCQQLPGNHGIRCQNLQAKAAHLQFGAICRGKRSIKTYTTVPNVCLSLYPGQAALVPTAFGASLVEWRDQNKRRTCRSINTRWYDHSPFLDSSSSPSLAVRHGYFDHRASTDESVNRKRRRRQNHQRG